MTVQYPIPAWLDRAYRFRGLKEIPGPRHNKTIMQWIKELGGWFTSDEVPWCGTFVAKCLDYAGCPIPKHWYRAKAYLELGTACSLQDIPYGAVCVKGRKGGGHVFFAVAQSMDGSIIYGLGGNQSNMVNIASFKRSSLIGARWPISDAKKMPLPRVKNAAELDAAGTVTES